MTPYLPLFTLIQRRFCTVPVKIPVRAAEIMDDGAPAARRRSIGAEPDLENRRPAAAVAAARPLPNSWSRSESSASEADRRRKIKQEGKTRLGALLKFLRWDHGGRQPPPWCSPGGHILFIRLERSTHPLAAGFRRAAPSRRTYPRFVDAPPRRSGDKSASLRSMTTGLKAPGRLAGNFSTSHLPHSLFQAPCSPCWPRSASK